MPVHFLRGCLIFFSAACYLRVWENSNFLFTLFNDNINIDMDLDLLDLWLARPFRNLLSKRSAITYLYLLTKTLFNFFKFLFSIIVTVTYHNGWNLFFNKKITIFGLYHVLINVFLCIQSVFFAKICQIRSAHSRIRHYFFQMYMNAPPGVKKSEFFYTKLLTFLLTKHKE